MNVATGAITCKACGRSFAWKPEYAGKTLKCKCGQPIKAPAAASAAATAPAPVQAAKVASTAPVAVAASPPVPKPAADAEDDFARLQAEAEYELAAAPPPPPPQRRVTVVPAGAPAIPGATSPVLGYAGAVRKAPVDEGTEAAKVSDLYIPIALIVIGLIAYFIDARLVGIHNPVLAGGFIIVSCVINLVLVFIALMIGVKLINLGLGPIGSALLKITAVAILPAALGDIVMYFTMGLVSWGVTLLMYYALLYALFDFDGAEIYIVTSIMWVVRFFSGMLLIGLLLTAFGGAHPMPAVAGAALGGGTGGRNAGPPANPTHFETVKVDPDSEKETPATPKEIDDQAQELISGGKLTEAREWLAPTNTHHIHDHLPRKWVQEQVDQLYAAGARKVYAADIENRGPDDYINQLLVDLPDDAATRKSVLAAVDKRLGREKPSKDEGGRYLVVPVY